MSAQTLVAQAGKHLPIRYVAQATGVLPVTLRAWERRYGLLKPERTTKGHRLYSEDDIVAIRQIVGLIQKGIPISRARAMLDNPTRPDPGASDWPDLRRRLAEASVRLDAAASLQLLRRAGQIYPMSMLASELILPVEHIIGQGDSSCAWAARQILGSACDTYLEQRSQQAQPTGHAAPILLAGLCRTANSLGARLFVAAMRETGIDARWLGPMPDIAAFCEVLRSAKALAGIVWEDSEPVEDWESDLRRLQRLRPCFVMLGGRFAARHTATLKNLSLPVLPDAGDEASSILLAMHHKRAPSGIEV